MHGAVLPNNVLLLAFVLYNLTLCQAESLFFPSIVDLDSAAKYLHSPKFNIAMKFFQQDLSKIFRSMFNDLSANVAGKFKGLYDNLDTYTSNEILTGAYLFHKKNRTQTPNTSSNPKRGLKYSSRLATEKYLQLNETVKTNNIFQSSLSQSLDEAMEQGAANPTRRTEKKLAKTRLPERTQKLKFQDHTRMPVNVVDANGGEVRKQNGTRITALKHQEPYTIQPAIKHGLNKVRHFSTENPLLVRGYSEANIILDRKSDVFNLSENSQSQKVVFGSSISKLQHTTNISSTLTTDSYVKSNSSIHFKPENGGNNTSPKTSKKVSSASISITEEERQILLGNIQRNTTRVNSNQVKSKRSLWSSKIYNTKTDNSLSFTNSLLSPGHTQGLLKSLKSGLEHGLTDVQTETFASKTSAATIEKTKEVTQNKITPMFTPISWPEMAAEINNTIDSSKVERNSSGISIDSLRESSGQGTTKNDSFFPSMMALVQENQVRDKTVSSGFKVPHIAIHEKISEFKKGGNSKEQHKGDNNEKVSMRKTAEINSQLPIHTSEVRINSRIRKRAAYDALMHMIANRWAKANNEEAESEEIVSDESLFDNTRESTTKGYNMLKARERNLPIPLTKTTSHANLLKLSSHKETPLVPEIHGKISDLCSSFHEMKSKHELGSLPLDQLPSANNRRSSTIFPQAPKLKRSFSDERNQTIKIEKEKREYYPNTGPAFSESVSKTDQLLDMAFKQFQDTLKSIIKSTWVSEIKYKDFQHKSAEDYSDENKKEEETVTAPALQEMAGKMTLNIKNTTISEETASNSYPEDEEFTASTVQENNYLKNAGHTPGDALSDRRTLQHTDPILKPFSKINMNTVTASINKEKYGVNTVYQVFGDSTSSFPVKLNDHAKPNTRELIGRHLSVTTESKKYIADGATSLPNTVESGAQHDVSKQENVRFINLVVTTQPTPTRKHVMRLERRPRKLVIPQSHISDTSAENIQRSVENFKKIARSSRDFFKNTNADKNFSLLELTSEELDFSSVLDEEKKSFPEKKERSLLSGTHDYAISRMPDSEEPTAKPLQLTLKAVKSQIGHLSDGQSTYRPHSLRYRKKEPLFREKSSQENQERLKMDEVPELKYHANALPIRFKNLKFAETIPFKRTSRFPFEHKTLKATFRGEKRLTRPPSIEHYEEIDRSQEFNINHRLSDQTRFNENNIKPTIKVPHDYGTQFKSERENSKYNGVTQTQNLTKSKIKHGDGSSDSNNLFQTNHRPKKLQRFKDRNNKSISNSRLELRSDTSDSAALRSERPSLQFIPRDGEMSEGIQFYNRGNRPKSRVYGRDKEIFRVVWYTPTTRFIEHDDAIED